MIVIDTSAMIAILFGEPEAAAFLRILFDETAIGIAAPTLLETRMVDTALSRTAPGGEIDLLIEAAGIECLAWTGAHTAIAHDAFIRFGKGRGHPARLNFGDCMSYAMAKSLDAPLLFKGEDFRRTDIVAAC